MTPGGANTGKMLTIAFGRHRSPSGWYDGGSICQPLYWPSGTFASVHLPFGPPRCRGDKNNVRLSTLSGNPSHRALGSRLTGPRTLLWRPGIVGGSRILPR